MYTFLQIALTDLINALGIVPDGLIGHSLGELGCSYADGSLTAEQMLLVAYFRGRVSLESSLIKGMMAAVGEISHILRAMLEKYSVLPFH